MARASAHRPEATTGGLDRDAAALQQAVADLVRVYQFRDRDRICCHDVSVTQCYALETVVAHGPMRLSALAERLFVIGRFLPRGPWDFPVIQAGRRSRRHFRD